MEASLVLDTFPLPEAIRCKVPALGLGHPGPSTPILFPFFPLSLLVIRFIAWEWSTCWKTEHKRWGLSSVP